MNEHPEYKHVFQNQYAWSCFKESDGICENTIFLFVLTPQMGHVWKKLVRKILCAMLFMD